MSDMQAVLVNFLTVIYPMTPFFGCILLVGHLRGIKPILTLSYHVGKGNKIDTCPIPIYGFELS